MSVREVTPSLILQNWADNSPYPDSILEQKIDIDSLRNLSKFFKEQPRLCHPLFFKTDENKSLDYFLKRQALSNFAKNKYDWWFHEPFDKSYLDKVKALCESLEIQYEFFPFKMGSFTSLMIEMIYNLQIPFKFIYAHPNGLASLADLEDDQIRPFLGKSKDEIVLLKNSLQLPRSCDNL